LGITQSTLLHWVVCAAQLDGSDERFERAIDTATYLLLIEPHLIHIPNLLGKTAIEYADEKFKKALLSYIKDRQLSIGSHSDDIRQQ